jgi:hypothetical protein
MLIDDPRVRKSSVLTAEPSLAKLLIESEEPSDVCAITLICRADPTRAHPCTLNEEPVRPIDRSESAEPKFA